MRVRIPTGEKIIQAAGSANGTVIYCCDGCNNYSMYPLKITGVGEAQYHVLQVGQTKLAAEYQARESLKRSIDDKMKVIAKRINQHQDYSDLLDEVKCPYCGFVQSWSHWTPRWSQTKFGKIWKALCFPVIPMFLFFCGFPLMADYEIYVITWYLFLLCFYIGVPIVYMLFFRRKEIKKRKLALRNRPGFYYWGNKKELINSPFAMLFAQPTEDGELSGEQQKSGKIRIITGTYAGAIISVGEGIVIGSDPRQCQLIIEDPEISEKHCEITYNAEKNLYYIESFSSNGVFRSEGARIKPGYMAALQPGEKIQIGNNKMECCQ